jgi:hypothetical protein
VAGWVVRDHTGDHTTHHTIEYTTAGLNVCGHAIDDADRKAAEVVAGLLTPATGTTTRRTS